ncbi:hypothetical protein C8R45DRAFT_1115480 [Mycena sanguinolenta]|nr:hypothetical protein C8R45DRAFT_1115480 [Mycena sanguinolenta]
MAWEEDWAGLPPQATRLALQNVTARYNPNTPTDASDDAVNPRKRAASDADKAATPVKRSRGCPRKDGQPPKPKASARPKTNAAPAPKSAKNTAGKKTKSNQENVPPPSIDLVDSDEDIEKTDDGKVRFWTAQEKTRVFSFILGPDADADRHFRQHNVNPGHASELFDGTRSADSVKSLYTRSLELYTWMRAFNDFTGNGGGDPDSDDPEAVLSNKLVTARGSGLQLGYLKPATILEWEKNGWLGTSAKVVRPVARSSAAPISNVEDLSDDGGSSDSNIDPELRKAAPT